MDEEEFLDGLYWFSKDATCVCGNILCENIWSRQTSVRPTHSKSRDKGKLHAALKSKDCGQVCQLLESGVELCTTGPDSCFTRIVKFWNYPFLHHALTLHPSAVNCKGPYGNTLLMLCETYLKIETLLKFNPDVNVKNNVGDNVLHNAVKKHLVKSFDSILNIAYEIISKYDHNDIDEAMPEVLRILSIFCKCVDLIKTIIKSGIDIDSLDSKGKTAIQILINYFKCGYIFTPFHTPERDSQNLIHDRFLCRLSNELVTIPLEKIIKRKPTLPPPDRNGRTVLMLLAQSPWNLDSMKLLIEQGVDVNAKDNNGHNAMYYLLKSFTKHCGYDCVTCIEISYCVDEMIAFLLDSGCQMQGTDLIMHGLPWYSARKFNTVLHLMALEDSKLNQRDLLQKNNNNPRHLSFLNLFLNHRAYHDEIRQRLCNFKMTDVALIEKELASGLKTNQIFPSRDIRCEEDEWKVVLQVTEALSYLLYFMYADPEEAIEDPVVHYSTVEGILRLLLPFWPNPPLSLLLIIHFYGDSSLRLKRLVEVLYDVGGPLLLGSELFSATKEKLESAAKEFQSHVEIKDYFNKMHGSEEIPSLQQLSRTVLRSSFSLETTDTSGLDLSSLKIKWHGTMLPLPQLIKNYINLKPLNYRPATV